MKKLFLVVCATLVGAFSLNAQKLGFRAEVGGNLTNMTQEFKEKDLDLSMLAGVRAGIGLEFQFSPMVYAATGLNYHMGGTKLTTDALQDLFKTEGAESAKIRTHVLSLPVNLGFRFAVVPEKFSVSAEIGPYVSYGISSKTIYELPEGFKEGLDNFGEIFDSSFSVEDPSIDNYKAEFFKRFEAGVGASVAAEYLNYYLRLGTTWGLTSVSDFENLDTKNNEFYLTVGLRF